MRNILSIASILLLLLSASCGKDATATQQPPVSTDPKLTWTYQGATFNATSIAATKPDSIPGTGSFWPYYEAKGTASGGTLYIRLTDLSVGNYTAQGNNEMSLGSNSLDVFAVIISSRSGNTANGTFSGMSQGAQVAGSFSNITFR